MGIKSIKHRAALSLSHQQKVIQLNLDSSFVKEYESSKAAAIAVGCSTGLISRCLKDSQGKVLSAKGYKWVKKEVYDNQNKIKESNCDNSLDIFNLDRLKWPIGFKEKMITKEEFEQYKMKHGKDQTSQLVEPLLRYLRLNQPTFPYPENEDDLRHIMKKISSQDFSNVLIGNRYFNNVTSSIGIPYLKCLFKNFWHSNYKKNKSPYDAWFNDKFMKTVVKYRIGANDSNETFHFTLHQMLRGISAAGRHTISFFKPQVAANIYKHFLGNNLKVKVIDPCAGFGGRLLGFASVYPNGTYIGIEPNKETFKHLSKLKQELLIINPNLTIELHNCKLEDYNGDKQCDLTFTSIPYWDLENYDGQEDLGYSDINDWKNKFISSLSTYENLLVNLPIELQEQIELSFKEKYYLKNNVSHFNKSATEKLELILKMF